MSHLLIGNWKMNLGSSKGGELATAIRETITPTSGTDIWIAPPFTSISNVSNSLKGSNIKFGSQNVHWEDHGAFTGEVSIPMLKELGCTFVIVGHSERRKYFGETNNIVARRASAALRAEMYVAYCIGETLEERAKGQTNTIIQEQLDPIIYHLRPGEEKFLVISYEPAWAIGSGNVAPVEEIEKVHQFIKDYWKDTVTSSIRTNCPKILYGGSVVPENFAPIIASNLVDGALVGGASLSAQKLKALFDISEAALKL